MSACPPHILSRFPVFAQCFERSLDDRSRAFGQRAIRAVKPLASSVGAAAFLLVFSDFTLTTLRRPGKPVRVNVKEPIENQANRHFQT
jgi:hypothetical protein